MPSRPRRFGSSGQAPAARRSILPNHAGKSFCCEEAEARGSDIRPPWIRRCRGEVCADASAAASRSAVLAASLQ